MTILNLTEVFRKTKAGISLSADSDCNEDREAATGKKINTLLSFYPLSIPA
jgi:hypothetical protein